MCRTGRAFVSSEPASRVPADVNSVASFATYRMEFTMCKLSWFVAMSATAKGLALGVVLGAGFAAAVVNAQKSSGDR